MAKKGHARASAESASTKRLSRKLAKLEARVATASDKRDRAQARLDALAIMTDEVRAALAAAASPLTDAAASTPTTPPSAPAASTSPKPGTRRSQSTGRATRKAGTRSTSAGGRTEGSRSARATGARTSRRRPAGGDGSSGGSSS